MAKRNGNKALLFGDDAVASAWLVQGSPTDTLMNCENVTRFMGTVLMDFHRGSFQFDEKDGDACMRILHSVADALVYVRNHEEDSKEVANG